MRTALGIACLAAVLAPVSAEAQAAIDVPAGTLRSAIVAVAQQTGADIALADRRIAALPTPRVHGRMSAAAALRRLVSHLPVRVAVIDAATFRLVPAPRRTAAPVRPPAAPATAPPSDDAIIIVASKRAARASGFGGLADVVGGDQLRLFERDGTEALARALTSLSSTHLGNGRDKLFVRGVGDSSFSGLTQATVGQYLGEARINHAGPDPDLRLYDVAQVELLPGPQGSLYGAGSLGGVLRVEPTAPDPAAASALLLGSVTGVAHGAWGGEAAAVLNLPLGGDAATRLVGYRVHDGGYVDDTGRGRRDVNGVDVTGGRAMASIGGRAAWQVQLLGLFQNIAAADASYVDRRTGRLARSAALAEPYANRYRLGSVTLRRDTPERFTVANLSYAHEALTDLFAFGEASPDSLFLARDNRTAVLSAEARTGHSAPDGAGWLVGAAYVHATARLSASVTRVDDSRSADATRSTFGETVAFGEAARRAGPLLLSVGARVGRWNNRVVATRDGSASATFDARDEGWRASPSGFAALRLARGIEAFARYAQSYRPPVAAVSPGGVSVLKGDTYRAIELGFKRDPAGDRALSGRVGISFGRWHDVQADIVDSFGSLTASNVGDARITTWEASARWRWSPSSSLVAGATFNRTAVHRDGPSTIIVVNGELPNVPDVNARIGADHRADLGRLGLLGVSGSLRYLGRSEPGVGPLLGRPQGGLVLIDAQGTLARGSATFFLRLDNVLDDKGNRFAIGSIAQAASPDLYVPQPPRTVTVGARFAIR